ncbi:hypothetical protein [Bacillus mojavensis]
MRKVTFDPKFKKNLSEIEIKGIEKIVDEYSMDYGKIPNSEGMEFAYTSSSQYAMYNVTGNVEFEDPETGIVLEVSHFSITENDILLMVAYDVEENPFYFRVEPNE